AHATVHLLTDRLSPTWRALLARLASLLATLFFIGLAAGAFWLTSDFWLAHEESEVLHISFRPLRVISALAALGVAAIFTYRAFRRTRDSR
ncbi:MAG TPA: hypothetical protein VET48_00095, partial [Steroidobacteraceae bacterium]|nr:hypothetical protein [Steroidobacteraceae bacterium]